MTRAIPLVVFALAALGMSGALSSASADGVRIGVNIGIPAPVVVVPAPVVVAPPAVVVGPPVVITPATSIYFYGGTYYTPYNGAWFVSPKPRGPWGHYAGPPPWQHHRKEGHWKEGHGREGRGRGPKH